MAKQAPRNIIISRTDSIGDVILTLPVAKVLKDHFPGIKIAFMGKAYTHAVINACEYIDQFIDVADFLSGDVRIAGEKPEAILHVFPVAGIARHAKSMGIPLRIGTTNRLYHWFTCNKLVKLSRKNSPLHEAQLNLKLLDAFGMRTDYSKEEIGHWFGMTKVKPLDEQFTKFIAKDKVNVILHPKSQGSAREWGLPNFIALINTLDITKFNILISGTAKERTLLNELFEKAGSRVTDITGLMSLEQFIAFISRCDALVANSTGPLHIASALGKAALGIYPPIRPMHPGRWAPIGPNARYFVLDKNCSDCRKDAHACSCITAISPLAVAEILNSVSTAPGRQTP